MSPPFNVLGERDYNIIESRFNSGCTLKTLYYVHKKCNTPICKI